MNIFLSIIPFAILSNLFKKEKEMILYIIYEDIF